MCSLAFNGIQKTLTLKRGSLTLVHHLISRCVTSTEVSLEVELRTERYFEVLL